jgi:hypothetical protein
VRERESEAGCADDWASPVAVEFGLMLFFFIYSTFLNVVCDFHI